MKQTESFIGVNMKEENSSVSLDVEYESANCWTFTNNRYEIPPSCKLTISPSGVVS